MNNFVCLLLLIVAAGYLLIYLPFIWRSPQRERELADTQKFPENREAFLKPRANAKLSMKRSPGSNRKRQTLSSNEKGRAGRRSTLPGRFGVLPDFP